MNFYEVNMLEMEYEGLWLDDKPIYILFEDLYLNS